MRAWRGTRRVTVTGASPGAAARPQRAFDLADAFRVRDRRTVLLEHVIQVEAEAVAGRVMRASTMLKAD